MFCAWVSPALLLLTLSAEPRALTSIDDALRLTPEAAAQGQPVRLRGVVSYADPVTRDFFFQDERGVGISLWHPDPALDLKQGDLIEVEGRTERGDYAPKLALPLTRLERLGRNHPLEVTHPTQAQLTANGLDCRFIEVDVVVRDVILRGGQVELRVASLLGPTRVLFATGVPAEPLRGLTGAEVRIQATVGVDLNAAQQRLGLRLYAQSEQSLRILRPSSPPSELGRRALRDLLRFNRTDQNDPRLWVEGDVIYASGRQLFLADGDAVARVRLAESAAKSPLPALGARIQVMGFVEPGDALPQVQDAQIVAVGAPGTLEPLDVTAQGLLRPELDDRLVRLQGRVTSLINAPLPLLGVETPEGPAVVMGLEPNLRFLGQFEEGAWVEVVGIKGRAADQGAPVVLLRRPEDLRQLRPRPFWSLGRALALAGLAVLAAVLLVLKWRWTARRARELERLVEERTLALAERSQVLEAQRRELVELHHVRARFIATAAHDLRSPLTVVLSNAELLAREHEPPQRQELAGEIVEAASLINQELSELVRSYRDERSLLRKERFDVAEAVAQAVERVRPLLSRKGQAVKVSRPSEPVWAEGDSAIYGHVVLNLLSNASKFSPGGSWVEVVVSPEAPQVQVRDHGPGLDPQNLERLFNPTLRPDVRPTAAEPSSQEGLLLCDRWMRTMGGHISCQSVVGQGATFLLSLPGMAGDSQPPMQLGA